jgi:CRISPR system Cascade subunit CasE
MMYLSTLLINVGSNPDRPRPGRLWLRNLYHVHQRLSMAFPSASRKSDDANFLKPFKPEDFGQDQVHVVRGADAGFLFRIDPQPGGRVVILVQSAAKPDWEYAFHNAGYLLAAAPEVKSFDPHFQVGQMLRFRVLANPTRRISKNSKDSKGNPVQEKWIGKRVPVPSNQLVEWLSRRAEKAGFSLVQESITVQPGYIYWKMPHKDGKRLLCARYDGILQLADPVRFQEALVGGLGPGKAFGFGLLSIGSVGP